MGKEKELKRVNWPEDNGKYKVVQLYYKGDPFLVYSKSQYSNHSGILLSFLSSLNLKKIDTKKDITGYPLAATKGEDYEVTGMGMSRVNLETGETKKASFSGTSTDYEMSIDPKHLKKIAELCPDWELDFETENV